jgi:hypothetical protein
MKKLDLSLLWPHRFWFALLAGSLALILTSAPLLRVAEDGAAKNLVQLQNKHDQTEQALHQLQDDVAAAQKLENEMTLSEAEQSLAPVDRLLAANAMEQEAEAAHLRGFSYTLSPEQKIKMEESVPEPQEVAVSTITLHGEAPTDSNIYGFISAMHDLLPGRIRLQQLSLSRIANDASVAAYNLRFNATFEWLSNGAVKDMAGGI